MLKQISNFYESYENLGLKVTFVLVSLQVIHLFWLTTFVIFDAPELTLGIPPIIFAVIDYLEIPALVSGVVFYSLSLHFRRNRKDILYIGLLLIQFLHLYWISDTFVIRTFYIDSSLLWLAYIAILIDYLELGVVYDLYKRIWNNR